MLIRITLLYVIFFTIFGCQVNQQKRSTDKSVTPKSNVEKSQKSVESNSKSEEQKIAARTVNPLNNSGSFMTLTPTGETNVLNNPLYKLRLYANGKLIDSFVTVSGRTSTQSKNRHQSGTEAPLPDGKYTVALSSVPGTIAEAGDLFLPIQPQFQTGRTALGFHVDPSFERNNGEDGTAGCIGLVSKEDLDKLLSFVTTYKPKFLDVNIQYDYDTYATESNSEVSSTASRK